MAHEKQQTPERGGDFESLGEIAAKMFGAGAGQWKIPKTPGELHERVCRAAEAIGADVETLYRSTSAFPLELARWLMFVEGRTEQLARIGKKLCPELRGEEEKGTEKCPLCHDVAYVASAPRGSYETVEFCSCERGRSAEVGWWWNITHPYNERARKRVHDPSKDAALARYCMVKKRDHERMVLDIKFYHKRYRGTQEEGSW